MRQQIQIRNTQVRIYTGMGGPLIFGSEKRFTGQADGMKRAWSHRLAGALMSDSILLNANVNSGADADESMQSFPSQQGSDEGME